MLALYRSGRQAEALEAFRDARETLVAELGIEPDPTLQRLHALILDQDASLEPPKPPAACPAGFAGAGSACHSPVPTPWGARTTSRVCVNFSAMGACSRS